MFESLQGMGKRNAMKRLSALGLSIFIHSVALVLLVVLPLVFMRVLPGRELLTILIAPPAPPAVRDAPPPLSSSALQGISEGTKRITIDKFVEPPAIPKGIPAPQEELTPVGAYIGVIGSGLGILDQSLLPGSALTPRLLASAPPKVAPPPPRPPAVKVGGDVQGAKLIRKVTPVYPGIALRARVSGEVAMEVNIDEEGNVSAVNVIRGHALLTEEAVRAVRQWKYSPTLLNGEPVPVISIVTVVFELRRF
jgi:protein TonB